VVRLEPVCPDVHVREATTESVGMPALVYGTAEHWLTRAREAREVAAQMGDPVAQVAMIAVAENYEIVAKRAEAREANVPMPNYPEQSS
jgi:hypothetical protein